MSDSRGRYLRVALGLALVVLAIVQVQQFAQSLRAQARQAAQLAQAVEAPLRALRPQIAAALAYAGPESWQRAAAVASTAHPEAEVELFDSGGRRLLARPRPAPVAHRLDEPQARALAAEGILTVGPVAGEGARLLTYAPFRAAGEQVLMRVAVEPPGLAEDLRDRRQALVTHVMVVLSLILAAVLVLSPLRPAPGDSGTHVLEAYAEAMTRLKRHGEDQFAQHRAERRRLEDTIRDVGPMARAGELTAGIVHEVRNGLGTILGYARLIEQADVGAQAREAARSIGEECRTLETVVRRFVEFVKAESLALARLDLRRMLTRVAAREGQGAGAAVEVAPGEELGVVGDDAMLERAFENLVRNAREAAGPQGHVRVEARRQGSQAEVTVSDDGPGMPPALAGSVRPFVTTKPGGLGLGLPLAIKIVRLHEGELIMAPRSPRGLVVVVRLPVEGPAGRPPEPGPREQG